MSKIVVFNGSPRKNGYTSKLLNEVVNGAKSKGAQVTEFDLNDHAIRGCQGCFYCRTHDGCATRDYLSPMYDAIKEADAIVFGSPIYYHQITGQARVWLDRTFPMVESNFIARHPGKKAVTIFTQGNPNPENGAKAVQFVNNIFESNYGWNVEDSIQCCGTSHGEVDRFEDLLKKAFEDGVNLVC